jgi:large subunit ribosomal protein L7/L12
VTSYTTFAEEHKSVAAAVSWMRKVLDEVAPERIVSITQSTAWTSGPGYSDWSMATMVVVEDSTEPPKAAREISRFTESSEDADKVFDVFLEDCGDTKVPVIKLVREITGWGLKEAKALVDAVPQPIAYGVSKNVANDLQAKFLDVGATIKLEEYRGRPSTPEP